MQAGWIKLSAGDDGLTACETKVLKAAGAAAAATGAVIGSHTVRGRVVRDQLDILASAGVSPDRFIWIHTQAEPDFDLHLEIARRGAWLEYDAIGSDEEVTILELARRVQKACGKEGEPKIELIPYESFTGKLYEDVRRRVPDASLCRELLGVEATTSLDEGLAVTVAWQRKEMGL